MVKAEAQNEKLSAQVEELRGKLQEVRARADESRGRHREVLDRYVAKSDELAGRVEQLKSQLEDARADGVRGRKAVARAEKLETQVVKAEAQNEKLSAQVEELKMALNNQRVSDKERHSGLVRQIRELKAELGVTDHRDIDPSAHNTAEAMDDFFSNEQEVSRYEEFALALKQTLRRDGITFDGKDVFDAGIGPGYALATLLNGSKPRSVSGLDYSQVAVDNCYKVIPSGKFYVGSLYEPIPGNYDLVFCTEVLEHLEEPSVALKRILSCVKSGGTAVLTVPNGRVDVSRLHVNFWSPESWKVFVSTNAPEFDIRFGDFRVRDSSRYRNNLAILRRI